MEDFESFINERKDKVSLRDSNCVGTALYLVGERDFDKYISRKDSKEIVSKMKKAREPDTGYLVLWENNGNIYHAGVVLRDKPPFHILHRTEVNSYLSDNPLEEFSEFIYSKMGIKPAYRIPNKLLEEKLK